MAKLKMLVAFGVGYVAGSAAGRQRYEDIKAGAQRLAGNPRVQAAAKKAQDTVVEKAPVVAEAVKDKASAATGAVTDRFGSSGGDAPAGVAPSTAEPPRGGTPLS